MAVKMFWSVERLPKMEARLKTVAEKHQEQTGDFDMYAVAK